MAISLGDTSVKSSITATLKNTQDLGTASFPLSVASSYAFANGTGANAANEVISDTRTLAASASADYDLSGVQTDAFGTVVAFTKIKALMIKAAATNTNDVVVGGAALNGAISFFGDATDKIKVKPGGMLMLVAPDANGYAITAGTADLLTIANSAGTTGVTYDIVVIGVV